MSRRRGGRSTARFGDCMSPGKKVVLSLVVAVPLAAGAAVYFVGVEEVTRALQQAGVKAFLLVGAVLYALMAAQAAAWARLEREAGYKPRYRTLLASTVVAMAGNIIMPSAHLGGEPAKILYAGRNTGIPYTRLAGTVLLCKYIEAMSFVLFFALGAVATLIGLRHELLEQDGAGRALGIAIIVVTLVAMVVCAVMWLGLARRWMPLTGAVWALEKLGIRRPFMAGLRKRALRMELWASHMFRQERRAVVPAFGWYLLTHILMFFRPFVFFYLGWDRNLSVAQLGLLFLASQVMLAIQFMPSGLGTLDGGMLSVAAIGGMGLDPAWMVAYLFCIRFWDATVVLLGMMLAARTGIGLFRKGPKKDEIASGTETGEVGQDGGGLPEVPEEALRG
jgi:uncharacterized protein (TIRG00374 family)